MEPMLVLNEDQINCQYLLRWKYLDKEELEGTSVYEIDNKKMGLTWITASWVICFQKYISHKGNSVWWPQILTEKQL
jgi:hypothetical protein